MADRSTESHYTKLQSQIAKALHASTPGIVERDELVDMTTAVLAAVWEEVEEMGNERFSEGYGEGIVYADASRAD